MERESVFAGAYALEISVKRESVNININYYGCNYSIVDIALPVIVESYTIMR